MTRFMNIFASVAQAASLAPVAASATIMTSWSHLQIEPHKAGAGPVPMVARITPRSQRLALQLPFFGCERLDL